MLSAMGIVRNVVDNEVIARAIDIGRDNISEGESIAGPLKKSGQFPPLVIHMINIGEKTGELENMLLQVSDAYDFQVKTSIAGRYLLIRAVDDHCDGLRYWNYCFCHHDSNVSIVEFGRIV